MVIVLEHNTSKIVNQSIHMLSHYSKCESIDMNCHNSSDRTLIHSV